MTDVPEKTPKTLSDRAFSWAKWVFFIAAFILVLLTILANMGGSNDTLKSAMEQYLTEATGYRARIGQLNKVSFFPMIGFDFERVTLHPLTREEDDKDVVLGHIDSAKLSMGFWEVLRKTGRVRDLELTGLYTEPGVILPKAVSVSRLYIAETPDGQADAVIEGTVGDVPFEGVMDMDSFGTKFHPSYGFGPDRVFSGELGLLRFDGHLDNTRSQPVINDLVFQYQGQDILRGDIALYKAGSTHVNLRTNWVVPEFGSALDGVFEINVEQSPAVLIGTVKAQPLKAEDFQAGGRLSGALSYVSTVTGLEDIVFVSGFVKWIGAMPGLDCAVWDMNILGGVIDNAQLQKECP